MTGVVCILVGCGIPTTANYIIMVTVAAPTLVQLGWSRWWPTSRLLLRRARGHHAAGGAGRLCSCEHGGHDPFKTGNKAFRSGSPRRSCHSCSYFSPSLLLVAKGFTLYDFASPSWAASSGITVLAGCA